MPYNKRTNYAGGSPKDATCSISCLGCLTSIITMIGLLWIAFHVSEIIQFITT